MKRLVTLSIIATSSIFGASSAMMFGGYLDYSSNSIKDKGYYGGIYYSYFTSPYKLELDVEHMELSYKNGSPKYKQSDLTVVGNYYLGYNTAFKLGIHNIFIDQENNPNKYDNIIFAGITHYKTYKYNFGFDIYRSDYDGFNVVQFSPRGGFNFGNYKSKLGSFYLGGQLNFIDISKVGYANKTDYINLDLKLQNFNGPFTTELFTSLGKNSYKVANNGFSVYNLKEEYKYTYGASVAYKFKNKSSLKATISKSKLTEGNKDIKTNNYMLSFSKSW